MKKQILITNDDSIHAPGLKLLTEIAQEFGEVKVVAPNSPQSGMGRAVTVNTYIRVGKSDILKDTETYICSGTPVDCIKWAIYKLYPEKLPDLVLSGINHGRNDGINILYSGTMSGALEGALEGIPSMGFSFEGHSWKTDLTIYKQHIAKLIEKTINMLNFPKNTCLNINIPNCPNEEIQGYKICRQAKAFWEEVYEERLDPSGNPYYWLAGKFANREKKEEEQDSDFYQLEKKYITIVPAHFDLTDYQSIAKFKNFEII